MYGFLYVPVEEDLSTTLEPYSAGQEVNIYRRSWHLEFIPSVHVHAWSGFLITMERSAQNIYEIALLLSFFHLIAT